MRALFVLLLLASSASGQNCLVFAVAPPPTGIATWSRAGAAQRHALIYLAGEYPQGFPFRSQIKDKDVDKLRSKGAKVRVLNSDYSHDDLDKAKKECEDMK